MASVKQISEDTIQIVVSLGYLRNKKIRKKKNFKIDKNLTPKQRQKEIERLVFEYETYLKNSDVKKDDTKLVDFIDIWWNESVIPETSPTTRKRYESLCIPIKEQLGYLKLKDISVLRITRFKNYLATVKSKVPIKNEKGEIIDYKNYSSKTQKHYWVTLSTILNYACKLDYLTSNPCNKVSAPKLKSVEANYLEVEEIKNILELLKKEPIKNRVLIETYIFTGARRGEIMAIEYSDINFENATIKINKTSEYITGEGIITKEPKTKKSIRTIYIPQFLVKELKAYRVWHNQERLLMR